MLMYYFCHLWTCLWGEAATLGNVLRRAFGWSLGPKWLSHGYTLLNLEEIHVEAVDWSPLPPHVLQQVPIIFQRWVIVKKEPSVKTGGKEPRWKVEKGQEFWEKQKKNPHFLRGLNRLTVEKGARRDVGAQRRHRTEKEMKSKLEELG